METEVDCGESLEITISHQAVPGDRKNWKKQELPKKGRVGGHCKQEVCLKNLYNKEFGPTYPSCHPETLGEFMYPMPARDSGEK